MTPVSDPDSIDYVKAIERLHQQTQYNEFLNHLKLEEQKDQEVLDSGTVLEMLVHLNSEQSFRENAEDYFRLSLLGTQTEPVGAKWVQYWFGRNLAIFNNIVRNTESGDRVLVIYGAGHDNYFRQFASDSGLYSVQHPLRWFKY